MAGAGADTVDVGCGWDAAGGQRGDDLIYADCADGKGDVVDCGSGNDIVFWRVVGTVLARCEHKFQVTGSGA